MTIINPNSISGISSITALNSTAAINLFKADGTSANIIAGVTTGANFITGTSNVHSTGYECTNINASGIITATSMDMISTDAGSSAAPEFKLYRNSASPADADYLGQIKFAGESDTGVERNYAKITGKILDASNGTEDGIIEFAHIKNGSQTITGRWRSDSLQLLNGTNLTVDGSVSATSFTGSGANLTSLPAQATIANNADNRIITGGSGVNLNGESNLTFDGNNLAMSGTGVFTLTRNSRTLTLEGNYGNEGHPAIKTSSGHDLRIMTNGNNEKLRIDSSGRLLIANISSRAISNVTAKIQLEGTSADGSAVSITRNSANANPPYLNFGKSRATSTGGNTIIQNGDNLGEIRFSGADGNDLTNHAASINAEVDGSPSNNVTPGRLIFSTAVGSDPIERARIDSGGRFLLGTTSNTSPIGWNNNLQVAGTSAVAGISIRRDENGTGGALLVFGKSRGSLNGSTVVQSGDQIGGMYFAGADGTDVNSIAAQISVEVDGTPGSNDMPGRLIFKTTADGAASPTERLRINSSGAFGLGGANYGTNGQVLTSQGAGQPVTWKTIAQPANISNISGNIFAGSSGQTLTITGQYFETGQGVLNFTQTSDGVNVNVNVTPSSDTSMTVTVPSSVGNNVTAGNAVTIKFTNESGFVGDGANTTVLALPSGGSVTTSGNYRIHTFTSSSNFVLTKSVAIEYLVIAGGGGGGGNDGGHDFSGGSGGGGAGGYRTGTVTPSANTHTITVGGGGAGNSSAASGSDGSTSAFGSVSSVGGGGGGGVNTNASNGRAGGSGGGAGGDDGSTVFTGGAGTSGQGNAGGQTGGASNAGGGGGGGAGAVGTNGNGHYGGHGGAGSASSINGSSVTRAGGGGGGGGAGVSPSAGGTGGGGQGAGRSQQNASNGSTNTGSGGGGAADSNVTSERAGANGGSGLVIVRYNVTSL